MAGLQELAALVGITEAAIRGISSLHSLVKDLQNAPKEIERLRNEASDLTETLYILLGLLKEADSNNRTLAHRIGLTNAINRCGQACEELQTSLSRWKQTETRTLVARVQFRRHKKSIKGVVSEIHTAKQTTILTVVVTQLAIQLQKPISEADKIASLQVARAQIAELSSRVAMPPTYNERRTLSGEYPSRTQTGMAVEKRAGEDVKTSYQGNAEAYKSSKRTDSGFSEASSMASQVAAKIVEEMEVRMKNTKNDGRNNVMGVKTDETPGKVKVDMEDASNNGDGNVMGISISSRT